MGIKASDLRDYVVLPVLSWMGDVVPYSRYGLNQVLGTAAVESQMGHYLDQTAPGPGPGYGIYQMEKATFNDHCDWMMRFHRPLWRKFHELHMPATLNKGGVEELHGNLFLATFMCRVHYYRIPKEMPKTLAGQAFQWKQYYNSWKGKGTIAQYVECYNALVGKVGEF